MPMTPKEPWPPRVGEPLPRAAAAYGVRRKLAGYSLDLAHEVGGPKALGFKRILGIMLADIDYVEGAIYMGILLMPVSSVEENPPWGISCVVNMPLRGRGEKSGRVVNLRTAWAIDYPGALPRLASAYLKP